MQDDIAEDAAEAVTDAPGITVADVKKKQEKVQYKSGTGKSEGRLIVRLLLIIQNTTTDCYLSLRKSEPLDLSNGVVSVGIDLSALATYKCSQYTALTLLRARAGSRCLSSSYSCC